MNIEDTFLDLREHGYIEFGSLITYTLLEQYFKCKRDSGWEFLTPYLSLKSRIEQEGFLCTSEGQDNGSLLILSEMEMIDKADRIMKNLFKKLKHVMEAMTRANLENAHNKVKDQHYHAQTKLSNMFYSMKSVLKRF